MTYDFRQKQAGRFIIHAYKLGGRLSEYFYNDRHLALMFARAVLKKYNVYKVKMWDMEQGNLILELG